MQLALLPGLYSMQPNAIFDDDDRETTRRRSGVHSRPQAALASL
jgi:hypothetical protein